MENVRIYVKVCGGFSTSICVSVSVRVFTGVRSMQNGGGAVCSKSKLLFLTTTTKPFPHFHSIPSLSLPLYRLAAKYSC